MDKAFEASNVRDEMLTQLMQTYGTSIMRMCQTYLKDVGMAEDAAQDTFVKAYKSIDRIIDLPDDAKKPWLMRIAINTCKEYHRSSWFRHVDRHIDPESLDIRRENVLDYDIALLDAVMELPTKLKETVLLHYYHDLQAIEVARTLDIAISTVYSRLEKAQKKLRQKLEWEVSI